MICSTVELKAKLEAPPPQRQSSSNIRYFSEICEEADLLVVVLICSAEWIRLEIQMNKLKPVY